MENKWYSRRLCVMNPDNSQLHSLLNEHQDTYGFLERLKTPALWLIVMMYVLVIVFYLLGITVKYNSANLILALNIMFVVIPSFFIAFIAARGFLRTGSWPVMWMGIGTLSFGLAVFLSYFIGLWAPINASSTNFPIIALLAGLFNFFAASFLLSRTLPHERGQGRLTILLLANVGAIAMIVIVTIISIQGILPPFFIQGAGSTPLRQIILVAAASLFLLSGLIICQQYLKSKSVFLYWYALGLLLIFLVLVGNLLVIAVGTPISWTLRITQLLGGVYLFMAALVILKEAEIKQLSAGEALVNFFQQEEYNLNILLESIMDAVIVIDPNFIITGWNNGAEKIYGWKAEEVIGNTTEFLKTSYHDVSREDVVNQIIKQGKWTGEVEQKTKDGILLSILESTSIIKDDSGEIIGFMSVNHNFTERKKAEMALKEARDNLELKVEERTAELEVLIEELKRSNAELQQFAHVSSHDLQEPLRTIASFTQLLERRYKGKLDSDADEFMDYIVDAAIRMKILINDLLEYSRVATQGKEFQQVDTEDILNNVLKNLKTSIEENNAKITHDPLPTVTADKTQLNQVFQNLVGNAIKFKKPDEPPKIHISAQKENNEYLFSVHDNGIGMEPQYIERIFVIFQRLHTIAEYNGTGIGLSITKRILERHGGRIWVESEFGEGSTFYFTIPIEPKIRGE